MKSRRNASTQPAPESAPRRLANTALANTAAVGVIDMAAPASRPVSFKHLCNYYVPPTVHIEGDQPAYMDFIASPADSVAPSAAVFDDTVPSLQTRDAGVPDPGEEEVSGHDGTADTIPTAPMHMQRVVTEATTAASDAPTDCSAHAHAATVIFGSDNAGPALVVTYKLVNTSAQYLVHLVSCEGTTPSGRARRVFAKFPYASPYRGVGTTREPGTISIHGDGTSQRFIVNLYARLRDGAPAVAGHDTSWKRAHYLQGALDALYTHIRKHHSHDASVAFPWYMGCGADGGGVWRKHRDMLDRFAARLNNIDGLTVAVMICKPRTMQEVFGADARTTVADAIPSSRPRLPVDAMHMQREITSGEGSTRRDRIAGGRDTAITRTRAAAKPTAARGLRRAADGSLVVTPRDLSDVIRVRGDFLHTKAAYLVHQVACKGDRPTQHAARVFAAFPHADVFARKGPVRMPGTFVVHGDGDTKRFVVNVHAQIHSRPASHNGIDSPGNRLTYFSQALRALCSWVLEHETGTTSFAFPDRIGCQYDNSGVWSGYLREIRAFARDVNATRDLAVEVCIYEKRTGAGARAHAEPAHSASGDDDAQPRHPPAGRDTDGDSRAGPPDSHAGPTALIIPIPANAADSGSATDDVPAEHCSTRDTLPVADDLAVPRSAGPVTARDLGRGRGRGRGRGGGRPTGQRYGGGRGHPWMQKGSRLVPPDTTDAHRSGGGDAGDHTHAALTDETSEVKATIADVDLSKTDSSPRPTSGVRVVLGDVLDAPGTYIVHQANCVSVRAAGLAKALFGRYPHANCYGPRREAVTAGCISVHGDGAVKRRVVNLFGQHRPGGPQKWGVDCNDTQTAREGHFRAGLQRLVDHIANHGALALEPSLWLLLLAGCRNVTLGCGPDCDSWLGVGVKPAPGCEAHGM